MAELLKLAFDHYCKRKYDGYQLNKWLLFQLLCEVQRPLLLIQNDWNCVTKADEIIPARPQWMTSFTTLLHYTLGMSLSPNLACRALRRGPQWSDPLSITVGGIWPEPGMGLTPLIRGISIRSRLVNSWKERLIIRILIKFPTNYSWNKSSRKLLKLTVSWRALGC